MIHVDDVWSSAMAPSPLFLFLDLADDGVPHANRRSWDARPFNTSHSFSTAENNGELVAPVPGCTGTLHLLQLDLFRTTSLSSRTSNSMDALVRLVAHFTATSVAQ